MKKAENGSKVKYGEVWREDLGDGLFRNCLIVSPNSMNESLGHVLVVPVVSRFKHWPTRITISLKNSKRQLQVEQVHTAMKTSLVQHIDTLDLMSMAKLRMKFKAMLVEN